MLKVVGIVDKKDTAIDRLAQATTRYNQNLDYVVLDVHPKRPDPNQLQRFEQEAQSADIIHFAYFRTALMLLERYPWLKDKKNILDHYNPYSITESNWDQFDMVTACNKSIYKDLRQIMHNPAERLTYVPLAVDAEFWTYNFDWKPTKRVIMVANRIEAKKGILEVAIACGDLGLTFVLVGAISDREYFHSILQTGNVEFHEQISDEKLKELYYGAAVHVCNSVDNFESGTMPILESMLCGTPVLTRMVGHVPDLYDDKNLTILDGQPSDVIRITHKLEHMLNNPKELEEQRSNAWNTAKGYNSERRAYSYQRLYRSLLPGEPVSIIVPVYDKPETIRACLNAIAAQDYPNIELIVCDDMPTIMQINFTDKYQLEELPTIKNENKSLVKEFSNTVNFPVSYINTSNEDYGLARARNTGIIEATGDIIVFCDQRQIMAPNAVAEFAKNLTPQTWLYGDKGAAKKNFVENFSCIFRGEIIKAGMFNERVNRYGGMSQEVRERTKEQGFRHVYLESAKATAMGKSSNRNRKKADIIAMKNMLWKMGL